MGGGTQRQHSKIKMLDVIVTHNIILSIHNIKKSTMVPNQIVSVSEQNLMNEMIGAGLDFGQTQTHWLKNSGGPGSAYPLQPRPQYLFQHLVAPTMTMHPPVDRPSKKSKVRHDDVSTSTFHEQHLQWSSSAFATEFAFPTPPPETNMMFPSPLTIDPAPMSQDQLLSSALAQTAASDSSFSLENPYSTSRGLRQFSMKVCEKVAEKGPTTYSEVADEVNHTYMRVKFSSFVYVYIRTYLTVLLPCYRCSLYFDD